MQPKDISPLMGTSLHAANWSMRFVFGRIHPPDIYHGLTSDPDYHFTYLSGHPLQPQSCVRVKGESSCCI